MREIKFRAWDKIINKMYTKIDSLHFEDGVIKETIFESSMYYDIRERIENVILMQYTGLTDKEGTEIYEGDIIHVNSIDPRLYAVEWHRKTTEFLARRINGGWSGFSSSSKIIGNIYENSELLE